MRFKGNQFADKAQHVFFAFARGNEQFYFVRKQHKTHFVAVFNGGKGKQGGQFGGDFLLEFIGGAEFLRGGHVARDHQSQFAFFVVFFDVGNARARGDVPVNGAHVVAGGIFAHFGKFYPLAFKRAQILSGERFRHQFVRLDFNLAYFF